MYYMYLRITQKPMPSTYFFSTNFECTEFCNKLPNINFDIVTLTLMFKKEIFPCKKVLWITTNEFIKITLRFVSKWLTKTVFK